MDRDKLREKIQDILSFRTDVIFAYFDRKIKQGELELFLSYIDDQILALIPDGQEKRLDRPELRGKIQSILDDLINAYDKAWLDNATFGSKQFDGAIEPIIALIPDIEEAYKQGYQACAEKMSYILPGNFKKCREEAKREERERILEMMNARDVGGVAPEWAISHNQYSTLKEEK